MPDKKVTLEMIPYITCRQLPNHVEEWCGNNYISTHYQSDVACIEDDGNPFAEWLKSINVPCNRPAGSSWGGSWVVAIQAS
jgi:hypothetical protein